MRLLTRRIYRAFPELDQYDDVQCIRFLKAAEGGFFRANARRLVTIGFGIVLLLASGLAIVRMLNALGPRHDPFTGGTPAKLVAMAIMAALIAPAPVTAYLLRDWLLRRRVRFVLRTRGVCSGCWYSLIGLPVGTENQVLCPECGIVTKVDPSLGELVLDDAGQRRFRPEIGHVEMRGRFWNRERAEFARRLAIRILLITLVAFVIALGGYEIFLRRQAAAARAARTGVGGLMKFVRDHQPPGPDEANAWPDLVRAVEIVAAADARVWRGKEKPTTALGNAVSPDFEAIFAPEVESWVPLVASGRDPEYRAASMALARQMLLDYEAQGLFTALAAVATQPRAIRELGLDDPAQPPFTLALPELGSSRNIGRICAAQMRIAYDAKDLPRFRAALEGGLAVARACQQQPLLIDDMVGIGIEHLMLKQIGRILRTQPPAKFLDAMAWAVRRQTRPVPPEFQFEGEELFSLDSIAWAFSDPERARFGRLSPALNTAFGSGVGVSLSTRLSTFHENCAALKTMSKAAQGQVKTDPWQRPPWSVPTSNLLLIDLLTPSYNRVIVMHDDVELDRRGIRTMLAIEQTRLQMGCYPEKLSDIPNDLLSVIPRDPWRNASLSYRRLPSPDEYGRGYVLYSVGHDGQDDSGITGDEGRKRNGNLQLGPSDIVINHPPPAKP